MSAQLFQPIVVGPVSLKHRVVLAPLTRLRTDAETYVPLLPLVKDYYTQRGTPGTLLISESVAIATKAGGLPNMPGISTAEEVKAWTEVVDSVHAQGSFIFLQIGALGRMSIPAVLKADDPRYPWISASDIPVEKGTEEKPRPKRHAGIAD
ncbi:hypothetical protein DFH06DRAFT_1345145 [Mycena polygramma]|nr:hypothetical protein DFH06DRAFT_1345145 [Mycena polygramma]